MNGPKPGYETTEFWAALFVAIIGALASVGILTPAQASAANQTATSIAGLVVAAISVIVYLHSRTQVKKAAYDTTAKVQTARAVAGAHQAQPDAPPVPVDPTPSPVAALPLAPYAQVNTLPDSPPSPQYGPVGQRPPIMAPSTIGLIDPAKANTAPSV